MDLGLQLAFAMFFLAAMLLCAGVGCVTGWMIGLFVKMDDYSSFPEQLEMEEEIQEEEEETPEEACSSPLTSTTCFGMSQLYNEEDASPTSTT